MRREIPQTMKKLLVEVKKRLKEIYGDNLKDVILYGSYARGDFSQGSDIDLIILLGEMEQRMTERKKYFDAIWELELKYDMVISILPFKEEEYKTRRLPIILNAKREGISI
ncbi:MAG: nucleotidyltransferase domain-containing protein [Candidatus Freyarchaeota archaeon]|nr:nucleotidyltransferase domain-containing protein [Candidatus Freyarchaeota archaeon]